MSEREQIVAWLKGQIATGNRACMDAKQGSRRQRDLAAGVVVLTKATEAIERGTHLQEQSQSPTSTKGLG